MESGRGRARAARHAAGLATAPGRILTAQRRSSGKSSYWAMTYRFSVDQRDLSGKMTYRASIPVGTAVTVGYMPFDVTDNWIVGYEPKPISAWAGPIISGVVFVLVALVLDFLRRRFLLLSKGRPEIGRVTGKSSSYRSRAGRRYRWRYEFEPEGGGVITKKVETGTKPPPPDAGIVVIYDPGQPKRAILYPDQLMRVEGPAGEPATVS